MWSISRQYPLALVANGQTGKAYEDVLRQLTGHPYRAEAWRFLGDLALKLSSPRDAARAYGEAANRDSRDDVSREKLSALRGSL
jgi:cytochrome c-type biogenesis protein CcmH/NrfG